MVSTTQSQSGPIDARPIRPTSHDTLWDHALDLRDKFAAEVRKTLESQKLDAAVFVSPNGSFPPWVKLEAWLPAKSTLKTGESRERSGLVFTVDVKPYHEHDLVVTADLARGKTKLLAKERPDFPVSGVAEWVLYALDRGPKPSNSIGLFSWQRPNNIMSDYRNWLTGTKVLAWASLIVLFGGLGVADNNPAATFLATIVGAAGLIVAALIVRFRKRSVSVTMQSEVPPRNLGLVDSWHAVVGELGRDFGKVRQQLLSAIVSDASPGITCQSETFTQRATNGYEQRERLVVSKDQGMVHVHIYQFGDDMYVGWYAYLNWAQWGETNPVSVRVQKGYEVEYRDLRPMTYVPNQFDLIDLSSLSEFVHRRLEREIKTLMKDRAIDQEIDFKVIRGDRDRALDKERHGQQQGGGWNYQ